MIPYFELLNELILPFLLAFILAFVMIPVIISNAVRFKLVDKPCPRKIHIVPIPSMGGIAIFMAIVLTTVIFNVQLFSHYIYFWLGLSILYVVGIVDDRHGMKASLKFLLQILCSFLVAYSNIRIVSFGGMLGIQEIPTVFQYGLTVFLIVGITNAFNLIDGIDGLAGGIGLITSCILGILCLHVQQNELAVLCFSLSGSLLAFLRYNFNPAKIFMGDTGSLVIGFLLSVVAIRVTQVASVEGDTNDEIMSISLIFGIFLLPVFDTIRVFAERIIKGNSPFKAEKNHVHHLLLSKGFSHPGTTLFLYFSHILIISTALVSINYMRIEFSLLLTIMVCMIWFEIFVKRERRVKLSAMAKVEEDVKRLKKAKSLT
jgi:UDP-N-acetylmuramyl pentapeptide phosphotransferase/UDP-N-acetylglucosamine-1-phosphate transferase